MINVVIAEDQSMLLTTLAALLDMEEDINVCYQAPDGRSALDYMMAEDSTAVNMLITDIEMPRMTGIELAQAIQHSKPHIKVIIVTTFSRSGYLRRAMDAGVFGYLLKDSPSDELLSAMRKVAKGRRVISPDLMQNLWIEQDPLTDKERQSLRLAKEGKTTEQIAQSLHLSAGTVRNYLSSASSKLQAKNRIEAARIAHQNGWL